jgi:hypothetical protein
LGSGSIAPLIIWPWHWMEVRGQVHAPAALPPRERSPGTHWIGGWVGPSAFLDAMVRRKTSSPCRESSPRTPIVQPVAQRYTDWAITALAASQCIPNSRRISVSTLICPSEKYQR